MIQNRTSFTHRPVFAILLLMVLALLLNWPYLMGGFYLDDIILYNEMVRDPLPYSRWLGVWSMDGSPSFDTIWWKDADFSIGFWRPIPSAVIEGSIRLFDKNAFPLHLLSILLLGSAAASLYLMIRKLTQRNGLALLAGLFFVTCEDHTMGVSWVAMITDFMCVQFILIALMLHIDWLQRRKLLFLGGSLIALIAAMGCKETASVAPLALVLLTFFMPRGVDESGFTWVRFKQQAAGALRDFLSWVPAMLVLIAYLVLYRALGFGMTKNLLYVDPIAEPLRYISHSMLHLPVLLLGAFSTSPIYLTVLLPKLLISFALAGLLVFIAWLAALWSFRHQSLVPWALTVFFIALLPQLGTIASGRGLYFPMIPAGILLAIVTMTIGPIVRRTVPRPPTVHWWSRFIGWTAMTGILVFGTLMSASAPWSILPSMDRPGKHMLTAMSCIEEKKPEHIIFLNTHGFLHSIYLWDFVYYYSGEPRDVWTLSSGNGVFSLERTGDSSFVIRTDREGWINNMVAKVLRTEPILEEGRRYETPHFTATLMELTDDRVDVLAVSFEFSNPLDDPDFLFLRWNGEEFEPLNISELTIGETVELGDTSNILEL